MVASIDKISLREEFVVLKDQFEELKTRNKITPDVEVLFKSMIVLFEILISIFLEKATKKTSKNSSLPPSQTEKDQTSKQRGSHSKGPNQNDETLPNVRTVEKVKKAEVNFCTHCGEDLENEPILSRERRTEIDILFEKRILHIDAEIKDCPTCGGQTKGWFPSNFKGPLQYGEGLRVFILNLLIGQLIPLKRVQRLIKSLIGKAISEATILKYMLNLSSDLESWENRQIELLLKSPSMNCDETSMKVGGKNHWVHVYSSGDIVLKFIHPKRGTEAIEDIGIIPRYGGVVIHDCWASYLSYGNCEHGLCGSHLLRELTFIVESNGYQWAKNMKALLKEASASVSKSKRKKLTKAKYQNLQKRYRNILTRGERELPAIPRKTNRKRGRVAKSDAHNLWERLKRYEVSVLMFARVDHVPFTNNRAEQDLRMNKVKQKISGSFRSSIYAEAYCRIVSYLRTMRNKGMDPMISIHKALKGDFYETL